MREGRGVHSAFVQAGSGRKNNASFEIDTYGIDSKSGMGCNNLDMHIREKERYVAWPHRAQVPFQTDADGWFLDAYEYTPEGIIFYDNGEVVAKAEWRDLTAQQMVWLTALNGCGKVDVEALPGATEFDYFRFYAKDYPGVNLLPNGSFEYNQNHISAHKPVSWDTQGEHEAINVVLGDAPRDVYKLRLGAETPYAVNVSQPLYHILNGEYMLTAKVRSSGGQKSAKLVVSGLGGADIVVPIKKSPKWREITIPAIQVANNSVRVSIIADGDGGEWLEIDDINFMKPPTPKQKVEKVPFQLFRDAEWWLAEREPVRFSGDQKFFFFDRTVGYGDAVTVEFCVNADEVANMTPIARVPQSGNDGWAVQLTADGGVIFRIGSKESHTEVKGEGAYKAGVDSNIKCVFDRGKVSIYSNGKLLKTESGVTHTTKDKTAAGRLGTVGSAYEAVNAVIMETGKVEKESHAMKNFRGTLYKVNIYNKVL